MTIAYLIALLLAIFGGVLNNIRLVAAAAAVLAAVPLLGHLL